MRKILAAMIMVLVGHAWGQTTWTAEKFTVSTDNMTDVAIVGGSVVVQDMPTLLALSNAGSDMHLAPTVFDLEFLPRAGYALTGEQFAFTVAMNVGVADPSSTVVGKASGSFAVGVNGVYALSQTSDGGVAQYDGSYFLSNPNLVAQAVGSSTEGAACPAGDAANGCNFGIDLVFQDVLVQLTALTVTPVLSAVPEPAAWMAWLAGLALLRAGAASTRSLARRTRAVR